MDARNEISPSKVRILDAMADNQFMGPVIKYGNAWEVETDKGESFILPEYVYGFPYDPEYAEDGTIIEADGGCLFAPMLDGMADYMPEGSSDSIAKATIRRGVWLARMSAPGYMDCTEWELHETAEAAADSLIENYADDADFPPED